MRYSIIYKVFFITYFLLTGCAANTKKESSTYTLTYIFNNYSMGPIYGVEKVKLLIKDKKIISILDLRRYKVFPPNHYINGIDTIKKALKNGSIKKTFSSANKHSIGSSYSVDIVEYKKVDKNYKFNPKKEKNKDFITNYNLWKSYSLSSYIFSYEDSKYKSKYIDGFKVKVVNNKVISVIDIFNLTYLNKVTIKQIKPLTIDSLFKIVKNNINKIKLIDYNKKYGYPKTIILNNRSFYIKFFK